MKIDLSFPALALVATQDTAGILRRTSGTPVSFTVVDGHNTVFCMRWGRLFVVSGACSSRAAISAFLGCFFWQGDRN